MVKNLPEEFFTVVQEPSYQESITGWIYTNHESSPFQEDIPLTNKNVVKGSLKVNKRCTTNNELIIGTACVGQLSVILTNIDWPSYGALDWLNGFRMSMSHDIFLRFSNEWLYLPLGNYYIDTVEVVDSGVSIIAYDEMSLFDVKPSYSDKRSYRNCWALISEAATACGVTYTETEAQFIADTHKVNTNEGITIDFSQYKAWREIIALAAQMIACNAIIARDEGLKFYDFYLNTSSNNPYGYYSFNEKQRLRGCKFSPYLVRYTSMYITDDNGEEQFYVKSSNEAGCVKLGKTLMNSYEAYPRTDQEVDQLRTNVLEHISYHWDDDSKVYFLQSHPFNVNIRFPCVMDVMDSVMFTGGMLGSEGYHWGIITSWEWTFQGGYKLIGTGTLPKVAMGISSTEKLVSGTTGQISKRVSDISDSVSDIDDSISDINDEIDSLIANKQNFIDLDILQPTGSGQEGDLKFYGPVGDGKKELYRYENGNWVKVDFGGTIDYGVSVPTGGNDGDVYIQLKARLGLSYDSSAIWQHDNFKYDAKNEIIGMEMSGTGINESEYVVYKMSGLIPGEQYTIEFTEQFSSNTTFINHPYIDYSLGIFENDTFSFRGTNTNTFPHVQFAKDVSAHTYTLTFTATEIEEYFWFEFAAVNDGISAILTITNFRILGQIDPSFAVEILALWQNVNGTWIKGDFEIDLSVFTGATSSQAGTSGLVPAPSAGDQNKFLCGDGTWRTAGGGSGSYSETLLWDYQNDNGGVITYNTYTLTLHDSVSNYDELLIEFVSSISDLSNVNWNSTVQIRVNVNALTNAYKPNYITFCTFDNRSSRFYINGTTFQCTIANINNINGVVKIYGINY